MRRARRSSGRARPARSRRRSSGRELHRAPGGGEHRRLDVEVRRGPPRRGCAAPPRRSSRRGGRRSGRASASSSSAVRMPRATSSQRVIPPKMLKRIERTCGSRAITSSAATTPAAEPPPPRSQKFAGRPPATTTTSTVAIESPAPLPRIPTDAVELDVGHALLAREALERVGRRRRRASAASSGWRKSAESSIVTFASSARTSPSGRDDQRVDLAERRVGLDEAAVEARRRSPRSAARSAGSSSPREQLARVVGLEALERVDVDAGERLGAARRRPARSRPRPAVVNISSAWPRAAVEGDREVVLARDLGGRLDPEPLDPLAADRRARGSPPASLGRLVGSAGELAPRRPCRGRRVSTCALTTTGPPSSSAACRASSGVDGEPSRRDRNPVAAEQLLALVLVEVHARDCSRAPTARRRREAVFSAAMTFADQLTARPDRLRAARRACSSRVHFAGHDYWATAVFCVAMSTDWFDGRIARRSGQHARRSARCSTRSPTRCSCSATLVVLLDQRVFPAWMVAAIVARELLSAGCGWPRSSAAS